MRREASYLRFPVEYFEGMLHVPGWSASGEAIDWPDGTTLAFGGEVALFLEGYALVGPPIHFAHVVHLLELYDARLGRFLEAASAPVFDPSATLRMFNPPIVNLGSEARGLLRAVREAGRPMRNLGALSAWLCRGVPPLADPPDVAELCARLSDPSLRSMMAVHVAATSPLAEQIEAPALTSVEFAGRFLRALGEMDPVSILAWLKHGRGPVEDRGEELAGEIQARKPRPLEGALAAVAARERLSGSAPLVGTLVGALALPPRRLSDRALPTGGYSDIGNRGRPEQILPSQFALDGDEFIRRFAEHELLYFRREEPHAPLTEELVLLIDQGVRTWGKVRVALAAAALALGKLAARRKMPFLVGSTGSGGRLLDPTTADQDELGRLWESSDLTVEPSEDLDSLLKEKGEGARDVVVLSHPRSLLGPGFAAATRSAGRGTRVFTVAIDEPGRVEFREWRGGVALRLGEFRVDDPPPPAPIPPSATDPRGWTGDVEPVGFPFRFGVIHRLDAPLFDFDAAGKWLLLATRRGILHAWALDGSRSEVFPRAMVEGEVMEQVDAVLGVHRGFVVAGRVGGTLVAMFYDLRWRRAKAFALGPTFDQTWDWFYAPGMHTVMARGRDYSRAVHLGSGDTGRSRDPEESLPLPVKLTFQLLEKGILPTPTLPIAGRGRSAEDPGRAVALDREKGEIRIIGAGAKWEPFTPMADGRPSLRGEFIEDAQLRGGVLALRLSKPDRKLDKLRLFHAPSGQSGHELRAASAQPDTFMLSPDGGLIGRRLGERQVEVRETAGSGQPVFVTNKGKVHTDLTLTLGRYGMTLRVGRHAHLIRWDSGILEITLSGQAGLGAGREPKGWGIDRLANRRVAFPKVLEHDPRRFIACARSELTAVVDIFGQVSLFDRRDRLLAMFLTFRSQVAAWMLDGTRLGPHLGALALIDGPPTPDAARLIGRTLKAASDEAARTDPGIA